MRNNPFVVFVTAFVVVLGSGLALAAIDGPSSAVDNGLESSSFIADFGGEIALDEDETEPSVTQPKQTRDRDSSKAESAKDEHNQPVQDESKDKPDTHAKPASSEIEEVEEKQLEDLETWIEVLAPHDGQVFEDKSVVFEGRAEPGASVHAGRYQADVSGEGEWRIVLLLSPGSQGVEFKALDSAANRAFDSVTVVLESPKVEAEPKTRDFTVHQKFVESHEPYEKFSGTGTPGMGVVARSEFGVEDARVGENGEWWLPIEFSGLTETTTFPITISTTEGFSGTYWFTYVAKTHEFSANQKYGSCSENPPYDVFFGSGVPGSVVEVGSAYGSGRMEVGDDGRWEVKVFFESAPLGETFEVSVVDSLRHTAAFSFTRLEAESH